MWHVFAFHNNYAQICEYYICILAYQIGLLYRHGIIVLFHEINRFIIYLQFIEDLTFKFL